MFFELCISPGKTGFDVLVVKNSLLTIASINVPEYHSNPEKPYKEKKLRKDLQATARTVHEKDNIRPNLFPYFHCDIVSVNNRSFVYIVTRTSDYQVIVPAVRFRNLIHTEIDPILLRLSGFAFIQYNERIVHTPIKNHFPVV